MIPDLYQKANALQLAGHETLAKALLQFSHDKLPSLAGPVVRGALPQGVGAAAGAGGNLVGNAKVK